MQQLQQLLSNYYNIEISSLSKAPRGFVGETHVVNTFDQKYFLKIFDKNRYFANVLQSLPVLIELYELGIDYINYPILTKNSKTYFTNDNRFYILLNFIEGTNTFEYDLELVYRQLIQIHKLTPQVKSKIKKETFSVDYKDEFEKGLEKYSKIPIVGKNLQGINTRWEKFQELSNKLPQVRSNHYITHGDALGNIIKNNGELFIIDWDDLILAPLERDLWFSADTNEIKQLYEGEFNNYSVNWDIVMFYIYNRFFDDLLGFFEQLDKGKNKDEVIKDIEHDCFEWLFESIRHYDRFQSKEQSGIIRKQ